MELFRNKLGLDLRVIPFVIRPPPQVRASPRGSYIAIFREKGEGSQIYKEQIQGGSAMNVIFQGIQSLKITTDFKNRRWEHLEVKFRGVWNFKKSSWGAGVWKKNGMTLRMYLDQI